jgi:methionyl-tRNA formyltransferase
MRLVFFGSSEFSVPTLCALADSIILVVTQPDKPRGRGRAVMPTPVKEQALRLNLPVETPLKARDEDFVARIASLHPDALLVAAYGQILPESLLSSATRGGINLHASLLPKYRGAAPIAHAILNGEKETGVTLMQMDKGMDSGDIIATVRTEIGPDETCGELEARLALMSAELAKEWMPRIVEGNYPRVSQDPSQATFAPKIRHEDARLLPEMEAEEAYRRYRAFTPKPGAWLRSPWGILYIRKARLSQGVCPAPGTVELTEGGVHLGFREGALLLMEVQEEGRKTVSGRDWVNGRRVERGHRVVEVI